MRSWTIPRASPCHDYRCHMKLVLAFAFIILMESSTCVLAKTTSPWSGSAALGFSNTTGTFPSLNLNSKDWVRWKSRHWQNRAHVSYNYTAASTAIYANRLVLENQSRYFFRPTARYGFVNIRYDRNPFDGYFYHLSEILGEGDVIHLNKAMTLNVQGGIGALEDQPIGQQAQTNPAARLAVGYQWHLTPHATFGESITALLSTANNNTYESVTNLRTRLYGPLALQVSYTATYNELYLPNYAKLNTITAVNLVYNF